MKATSVALSVDPENNVNIKRTNNTYKVVSADRGIRMVVSANRIDEAISLLRHAQGFYLEDTAEAKPRKARAVREVVEEKAEEAVEKDKVIFKIKYTDELGEVVKFKDVRGWLESQLADGPKSLDALAEGLAQFAKSTQGNRLDKTKKFKAARRTLRTYAINPRVANISKDEADNLFLVEESTDEE